VPGLLPEAAMPLEISGSVSMIRPDGLLLITIALITTASGTSRTGVGCASVSGPKRSSAWQVMWRWAK
jgi:hypothetical protein